MLGKLFKGVGILLLGVLLLGSCHSSKEKKESADKSKTEEVKKEKTEDKASEEKKEENKKEDEKFIHADFVGAEKITDKRMRKDFEEDGYFVYFHSADFVNGENYLLLPAYNKEHKMYDDIVTVIPIINGIPIKNEMQYLISATPYHLEGDLIDASDGLTINDAGDKLGSYDVILIKAQKDLTLSSKKYNKSFTVTYDDSNVASGILACLKFAQSQSK